EQLFGGGGGGQFDTGRAHADALTGVALHLHIGGGGGIIADQDGRKDRRAAIGACLEFFHPLAHLFLELLGQGFAVKNQCAHRWSLVMVSEGGGFRGAILACVTAMRKTRTSGSFMESFR